MEYAAIAAAAAGLISSLIGSGKDAEAQALRQQMLAQYGPEILPHLDQAVAQQNGGASLGTMQEDDSLRRRQLDALSQLEDVYRTGGNTAADRAAMELAADNVGARASQQGSDYEQAMRQRGMANSGLAAALQAQGQQSAANALGGMSRANAADARSRALRALESGAGLAGNIRDADFRRQQALAEAQDRINMFNTEQRTGADVYNRGLPQQQFDNAMLLNNSRANAANGVAAGYERSGQAARDTGAGVGNSLLTYGMWGESKKKKGE